MSASFRPGSASARRLALVALAGFVGFAACGGDPPPPAESPAAPAPPEPEPPPPAKAEPEAPEPEPTADPSAESGRPPVLQSDPASISGTFGTTPGAKLELGTDEIAVLRIPEGTLDQGYAITFQLDPKAKAHGAAVGKVYRLAVTISGESAPARATSTGKAFELSLPLADAKAANLALGEVEKDDKGKEKVTFKVVAPKRIDEPQKLAVFELSELRDLVFHLTQKSPDAP